MLFDIKQSIRKSREMQVSKCHRRKCTNIQFNRKSCELRS